MLQYRIAIEGGVRDVDEGKRRVLVTFPWERIDTYNTDFSRDCFDDYLSSRLPAMCWQHLRAEPIGRAKTWQKTRTANEFVAQFSNFDAVPRAKQAFYQIRDEEITDFSYAFDNAEARPHPSGERGQIRYTKAGMPEISPVTTGSIPGAVAVGVRGVDVAALRGMVEQEVISKEEAHAILMGLTDVPIVGERNDDTGEEPTVPEKPAERERIVIPAGARSITLTIDEDGTVTVPAAEQRAEQPAEAAPAADERADAMTGDDADAGELAQAVDAALDAMCALLDGVDTSSLPPVVQQALALGAAAGVAVDELLDAMGLPDPDEDSERAAAGDEVTVGSRKGKVKRVMPNGALLVDWGNGKTSLVAAADAETRDDEPEDTEERSPADDELDIRADGTTPKPPYGDVEYADPGYQSDKQKRYPLNTKQRVKSAWSYINQQDNAEKYSAEDLAKVKAKIKAAAKKYDIEISDDSSMRSEADDDFASTRARLDLFATR